MYIPVRQILVQFYFDGVPGHMPAKVIELDSASYDLQAIREHDYYVYMTFALYKHHNTLILVRDDDGLTFNYKLTETCGTPYQAHAKNYQSVIRFHRFEQEDMIYMVPRDLPTLFNLYRSCIEQLKRSMCYCVRLQLHLLPEIVRAIILLSCEAFRQLDQPMYCIRISIM